jgi:1,4-alpha-glucan branching enzyme
MRRETACFLAMCWACAARERPAEVTTRDASVALADASAPDGSVQVAEDAGPDAQTSRDAGPDPGEPACEVRDDGRPDWHLLHGGLPLGSRIAAADQVEFSLFAPAASAVQVMGTFNDFEAERAPLTRGDDGVWTTTLTIASPVGQEYRFQVDGRSVADPYARANDGNQGSSIIVGDSAYAWRDGGFVRPAREELVIYEVHPADFTRHASSGVSADARGTFAGFIDKIDHLQRLGVNAVELMPVWENQSEGYDWGYSASLWFAPDTWLAGTRKGGQVDELKKLVDALHAAGIAVIFDVVYNHVWGQTGVNHFWGVDPVYYFDVDGDGDPENDRNDWGYIVATQRPALRKLMYDHMSYLMSEFHADGFRIDATSVMDIDAVLEVVSELDDDGFCDRYYIAEEFDGAHNARIQAFNRELGRTLVSSWGTGYKNRVWDAIRWPASSLTDLTNVTYFSQRDGWNRSDEVVQYVASHDEGTINTWLGASEAQVRVAATHLLTAAGIPMLWLGEEFMRVHASNHGPNAVAAENNVVDWSLAESHGELIDYYGALVRLRRAHPSLHAPEQGPLDDSFVWDSAHPARALGYARWSAGDQRFVMLINYQDHAQDYDVAFPEQGTWHLMADGERASSQLPALGTLEVETERTRVRVPATRAHVYMR